ncbi:Zn-ribbon domain-containing OB-fold protein [Streptomyces canus]|uniref:Zn-ribbon domain-containing OB-fold protein n=1 Tax=Streptomyces canus TaxID=58343 RepID=UPI0036B9A204
MTTRLIDESLFDDADPPRLVGARCTGCRTVVFPRQDSCPRCSDGAMAAHILPDRGEIWSWTVQSFRPKEPYRPPAGGHQPYALGYVDLGEILVEARLDIPRRLIRIGLPVRLTTVEAYRDEDGTQILTFAFGSAAEDER